MSRIETPDTVYVFAGEVLIAAGPADIENRNVVRWFDSEDLAMSGFAFEIPADAVPEGIEQLTVAAQFGDVAVADPVTLPGLSGTQR